MKTGTTTVFAKTAQQARNRAHKQVTSIGLTNVAIVSTKRRAKRIPPNEKEFMYEVDWEVE